MKMKKMKSHHEDTKKEREQIKKEALEAFLKAKDEIKITKYENIKVI